MAKKKFLYPADWVKMKPYNNVDEVDIYYTNIANRIYDELHDAHLDVLFASEQNLRIAVMSIAGWFEDVISQNHIWQTFTAKCREEYGKYLPFFDLDDTYYPDEINKEDVIFLLWHNLQTILRTEKIVYPFSPVIKVTAESIYYMLEDEYETAPENERLHEFIYGHREGETPVMHYISVATWMHYMSFFNIETYDEYQAGSANMLANRPDWAENRQTLAWGLYISLVLNSTRTPLSLTTPQWLSLITQGTDDHKDWQDIEHRPISTYMVESVADGKVTLKDLVGTGNLTLSEDEMEFPLGKLNVGTQTVTCEFIKFAGRMYRLGNIAINEYNANLKEHIAMQKAETDSTNERAIYKAFKKATSGEYVEFFKTNEECEQFLIEKVGYDFAQGVKLPKVNRKGGIMLMASPKTGLTIQPGFLNCIKCDRNSFYDKEAAEKNALPVIARANAIPYEIMCRMQDDGMWPDVMFSGCENADDGRRVARENLQFIIDYYYHSNRKMIEKLKF